MTREQSVKLIVTVIVAAVSGCGSYDALTALQDIPQLGLRHQVALMAEYEQLALYEANERQDYEDSEYFAEKGIAAAFGNQILPDTIESRDIPESFLDEANSARAELVAVLYSGGRELLPEQSAHCLAMFDCWMAALEESSQPERTAQCRSRHYACMDEITARPLAPVSESRDYVIAFEFGSVRLNQQASIVIDEVLDGVRNDETLAISIVGHTDSVGSADLNQRLSLRRARAVADALSAAGIDPARITVEGRGEIEAAAITGDGVLDDLQRRVVVTVS